MYDTSTRKCQVLNGLRIDKARCGFVRLRTVHVGVGGTVNDKVDGVVTDKSQYCLAVGDIQLRHVGEEIGMLLMFSRLHTHFSA